MPDLEEADLIEHCVVYALVGRDQQSEPILRYPVQYACRWVDTSTLRTRGISGGGGGEPASYDAQVAIGVEDDVIPVGSVLWCGRLDQIPGTADPPEPTTDTFIVVRSKSSKDVWGDRRRTELMLSRHKGSIGTVLDADAGV